VGAESDGMICFLVSFVGQEDGMGRTDLDERWLRSSLAMLLAIDWERLGASADAMLCF
jgi:hypothetical protein